LYQLLDIGQNIIIGYQPYYKMYYH